MCEFKSAIVLPNGDLVHHESTDRHELLIAWAGLGDQGRQPNFVRVEFTSPDLANLDSYALRVDQDFLPHWWTPELEEDVARRLSSIVAKSIITNDRDALLGGTYILAGQASVTFIWHARVILMAGASAIEQLENSRVEQMCGSTSIRHLNSKSFVGCMRGRSRVEAAVDYSVIETMRSQSSVDALRGAAIVIEMRNSSCVRSMAGNSQIDTMWDTSVVGHMAGCSMVRSMAGRSRIHEMSEFSTVGEMYISSVAPRSPRTDHRDDAQRMQQLGVQG